jgi:galactofuranosylgalactofuranosylrhamnosyl-N-acetylglucosaminyl-diphospho-decaprenol beta-1,5/1,6-galactofuranosyltransferase
VHNVSITTYVSGNLDVELRSVSRSEETVIKKISIDSDDIEKVTFCFSIQNLDDGDPVCHYLLYRSNDYSVIESLGAYVSDVKPDSIDLGIVICTFNREDRLKNNVKLINQMILDEKSTMYGNVTIYIVDNGRTLTENTIKSDFIKLIPNKNNGGAGGFTRGIIECKQNNKSHILLMDDDVCIEPNVLYKTFRFISILKNNHEDAFILGGMLLSNAPCIQYEAGAQYIKKFERGKHMLDLTDVKSLLLNDEWEDADYGGWWYMCMPANAADELPLPMFIKLDDVEYGIRRMKDHVVMNGIGIWHDSFENKTNPVVNYYFLKRNTLIVWALYDMKNSYNIGLYYLHNMLHYLKKKNYEEFNYTQMAVKDFMVGPDFIKNTNQADIIHFDGLSGSVSLGGKNIETKRSVKKLFSIFMQGFHLALKWNKLKKQYREAAKYLSSYEFWKKE